MKRLLLAAGMAGLAFLLWYICPYAGGSDSSGYLNSARLLRSGHATAVLRAPPEWGRAGLPPDMLMPLSFTGAAAAGRLAPSYPVGLPLHLAAAGWIFGSDWAPVAVNLLAAFGFAFLLYLTAREFGVRPDWSAAAALVGALSPVAVLYALQPMSDLLAAAWALAAVFCALRSARSTRWALAAGVALSAAVLVRPTSLLLLAPVLVCLRPGLRGWIALALGGLPGALFLAAYNRALSGTPWSTGYGEILIPLMRLRWIPATLAHYAVWLPVLATPLVLAAAALPWARIARRGKLALALWAASFLFLYAAYPSTHESWWYLRFILPAIPALLIGAVLVLQDLPWLSRPLSLPGRRSAMPAAVLLLAGALVWQIAWNRHWRVSRVEIDERDYRDAGWWAAERLPADGLLAACQASGAIYYYSDRPIVRWDLLSPDSYARLNRYLADHRMTLYAALFTAEEEAALKARMPGEWEQLVRFREVTIWRRLCSAQGTDAAEPRSVHRLGR